MPRGRSAEDLTMLEMALVGYRYEREKIEEKVREIEAQLKGNKRASTDGAATAAAPEKPARRALSPAARRRIAAAQKKRWAEHRKMKAAEAKQG